MKNKLLRIFVETFPDAKFNENDFENLEVNSIPDWDSIENWTMSFRVLERGMENFIINYFLDFCKSHHIELISSEYLETPKNSIVKNLYTKLGFEFIENKYSLSSSNQKKLITKIKLDDGKK